MLLIVSKIFFAIAVVALVWQIKKFIFSEHDDVPEFRQSIGRSLFWLLVLHSTFLVVLLFC